MILLQYAFVYLICSFKFVTDLFEYNNIRRSKLSNTYAIKFLPITTYYRYFYDTILGGK